MRPPLLSFLIPLTFQAILSHAHYDSSIEIAPRGIASNDLQAEENPELLEFLAANERQIPALKACPLSCTQTANSSDGAGWFLFSDAARLAWCNETMLLDFVVKTSVDEKQNPNIGIRACTAEYGVEAKQAYTFDDRTAALCSTPNHVMVNSAVRMFHPSASEDDQGFDSKDFLSAGHQMARYLASQKPSCTNNAMAFGYSKSSVVGLFAGAERQIPYPKQQCSKYAKPIIKVQITALVSSLVVRRCISETNGSQDWITVTIRVPPLKDTFGNKTAIPSNMTTAASKLRQLRIAVRAECKTTKVQAGDHCSTVAARCRVNLADLQKYNPTILFCNTLVADQVVCCSPGTLPDSIQGPNSDGTCKTISAQSGDDCGSLANKCGLKPSDFSKVNDDPKLCSTPLMEGQVVCCSRGKFPDLRPKPNTDGSCATYQTVQDDGCAKIAASRGLTKDDIEGFNKNTWGWNGCKSLALGFKLCVSEGSPPMPEPVSNAVCGPTVPGTQTPKAGTDLATLNPCPLKVCCNIWGQCGMSDDFCTISKSETGAPGTSAPKKNGCISNCGTEIIKGPAPEKTMRITYFESWNKNRNCLKMDVDQIDTSMYTHIHFAFANLTADFKVDVSGAQDDFEIFKSMTEVKRIISFGGWYFSASPGTFNILREAVKPANRETFKNSVVAFVQEHGLDGVDIDWEYPGAPDIPDIPAGDPQAGMDYYKALTIIKSALGSSKTVSFAAPASYWYLKAFPVALLSKTIDYIVYMTYDLHGQWDYNNKWTSPGCPTGNCLRSHVNITETHDALVMITKAGVPSNKIAVGIASYGRSFKMAEAGCTGEMCKFTGTPRISNAAKGICTNTAGYISNAEINEIIKSGEYTKQWSKDSSSYLVYNETEWVAYMSERDKQVRYLTYSHYNFAGTSDWAADLLEYVDGYGGVVMDDSDDECSAEFHNLDDLESIKDDIPTECVPKYLTQVQIRMMDGFMEKYTDLVNNGYDEKFKIYSDYIAEQVPVQIDQFMLDNADKYFTCTGSYSAVCCNTCQWGGCLNNCKKGADCKNGTQTETVKCPDTLKYELNALPPDYTLMSATYDLKDKDGFFNDIGSQYGIDESWVTFGSRDVWPGASCQYNKDPRQCQKDWDYWYYKYPERSDDMKVYNPKDLIGKSYDNTKGLIERLKAIESFVDVDGGWMWADLLDASTMPALSLKAAVENMEAIIKKADEIQKEEREAFILNFVTSFLFFIPVLGEVAGEAGLTAIRSILRLVGNLGDLGLLTYSIVQDPKSAFMAIFAALAGAGVGKSGFRDAADNMRHMGKAEREGLGPSIAKDLDRIWQVRAGVCKI
ncbi:chitinase [Trichoderma asperellum]